MRMRMRMRMCVRECVCGYVGFCLPLTYSPPLAFSQGPTQQLIFFFSNTSRHASSSMRDLTNYRSRWGQSENVVNTQKLAQTRFRNASVSPRFWMDVLLPLLVSRLPFTRICTLCREYCFTETVYDKWYDMSAPKNTGCVNVNGAFV